MWRTTFLLSILSLSALPARARLGETARECEARYGKSVQESPGFGNVKAIRVYHKDTTEVMAFFTSKAGQAPTVGMIFYRVGTNTVQRRNAKPYADEEIKALLSTVTGAWADYTNPTFSGPKALDQFAGRSTSTGPRMQPAVSRVESRRAETSAAVKRTGEFMYPMAFLKVGTTYLKVTDVGHLGNTHFAFRFAPSSEYTRDAVAIVSYDALPAIQEWLAQKQTELDATPTPPKRNMTGF